jgi:hypothetical protein
MFRYVMLLKWKIRSPDLFCSTTLAERSEASWRRSRKMMPDDEDEQKTDHYKEIDD